MSAAAVSVIICTRNGWSRGFLDATLHSLLAQSRPAQEILLIDDASSDGTAAYVRQAYPQVTVLPNAGKGLAAARNTGVAAVRSAWVAFIDDDDIWRPEKLAEQLSQAQASDTPDAVVWASQIAILRSDAGAPAPCATPRQFATWPACLLGSPIQPSGVLLSKKLLSRMGPFNEQIREGAAYDYWIRCLSAGMSIRYSTNILLHYRQHHPQMTAPARRLEHFLNIDAIVAPYLERLAPALAKRVRCARLLNNLRSLLGHTGISAAVRYWRASVPRLAPGLRSVCYFLLDTVACRAPHRIRHTLRQRAMQLLIGKKTSLPELRPERSGHPM
ncbi:glycosyltransferase [Janthinobacterium sp. HSC-3S05]|uniref:glycosyltransferase family 2 protein n=1 Tax=Janthinobacterium lividum TaxID=29581 RepID=UPI001CD850F8|nr:glycosyltransferase family 2 protein [Janthinobacterium lividum]MCA1862041.1 glycosyltransferase [Janthinobacterium lividum]